MIRVEPARALDALLTLALHREVLAEDRWFVSRPEELTVELADREREIAVLGSAPNSAFLVARLPSVRLAGYVTLTGGGLARTRHLARVELLVAAAHRGQGVGRALLGAALAHAEASGVVEKVSLAVLADNPRAIALYRAFGFVEEGRRVGEYREADGSLRDDLLMARRIDPQR